MVLKPFAVHFLQQGFVELAVLGLVLWHAEREDGFELPRLGDAKQLGHIVLG